MKNSSERADEQASPGLTDASRIRTLDLVGQVRAGDSKAAERLVDHASGRLLGLVMYLMGPRMRRLYDPEDVTQEIWLEVFKTLPKSPPTASFGAWVSRIATRKIGRMSERGSRAPLPVSDLRNPADSQQPALDPSSPRTPVSRCSYRKESVARLVDAVESLPNIERQAWSLHWFEERTFAEIAPLLEKTQEAAAQIVKRANKKLRKQLSDVASSAPGSW